MLLKRLTGAEPVWMQRSAPAFSPCAGTQRQQGVTGCSSRPRCRTPGPGVRPAVVKALSGFVQGRGRCPGVYPGTQQRRRVILLQTRHSVRAPRGRVPAALLGLSSWGGKGR